MLVNELCGLMWWWWYMLTTDQGKTLVSESHIFNGFLSLQVQQIQVPLQ